MKLSTIFKEISRKLKGSLQIAKENGMIVEEGVTVMGGVDFGSEPYLITLRKNCRITGNVTFVNHDGVLGLFDIAILNMQMLLNMDELKLVKTHLSVQEVLFCRVLKSVKIVL